MAKLGSIDFVLWLNKVKYILFYG